MERKTRRTPLGLFYNQKIGTKILTGYVVAFMLAAIVGGLAIYQFEQVSATINHLTGRLVQQRNLAEGIAIQIHLVRIYADQYIYQGQDPADLEAYNHALGDAQVLMNEADQVNAQTDCAELQIQVRKDFNSFAASFAEIVQLLAARQSIVNDVLAPQGAVSVEKLAALRNNSYEILDFTTAHYASQARDTFSQMQVNVIQYLATGTEHYANQVDADFISINSTFDLLQASVRDDASSSLLNEIKSAAVAYYQGFQNARAGIARQHELTTEQLDILGPAIVTNTTAIADDVNAQFTAQSQAINALVRQIQTWTIFTIVLAIIVGIIFDLMLSQAITHPIIQMARAAQGIANGALDQEVEVQSKDELGVLAGAFNHMTTRVREAMAALSESRERYLTLFETANDALYLMDGNVYIECNLKAVEMFGCGDKSEMINHTLLEFSPAQQPDGQDSSEKAEKYIQIALSGTAQFFYWRHHRKDRTLMDTEVSLNCLNLNGKTYLQAIVRDITERKQAEEHIQNQLEHLNALHNIDNAIKSSNDLSTTLKIFLDEVSIQLKVDATSVLLFNANTLTLGHAASCGFHSSVLQYTKLAAGEGYAGRAVLEEKTIYIPDLTKANNQLTYALSKAGESFITYVGSPLIAKGQVVGVLEIFQRSPLAPDPEWFGFLDILVGQAAIAIDNAKLFENLQYSNFELTLAYDATIEGWSRALDLRDKETEGHTQRVTALSMKLAQQMGIPDTEIVHIRRGALLHDIGKMGIPDDILHKADKLTQQEWDIMHQHTIYAYEMLHPILYLKLALDIPQYHHEKWDGTGYPHKLKGEDIPLAARIFSVVDVWDAVTSDRPYRNGWTKQEAIEYIKSESGKHFDPRVVEIFLPLIS